MLITIFGLIAGIITGLGMGGGTVLIPLLSVFLNIDQHTVQMINLVYFIPTSISAIIINIKNKNIDYHLAKLIIIYGIIGTIIGAGIAQKLDSLNLKKYFAIFILLIAAYGMYNLYKEYINKRKNIY